MMALFGFGFLVWVNTPKLMESHRSIQSVNRANLKTINILLNAYREDHDGQLPKLLDDLKSYLGDGNYSMFTWKSSFKDEGKPWVYSYAHPDGVLVASPKAINGIVLKLTVNSEIIEQPE